MKAVKIFWQPLKTFPYNQQWNRKVRVRGALPHTPISKNKFLEMPFCISLSVIMIAFMLMCMDPVLISDAEDNYSVKLECAEEISLKKSFPVMLCIKGNEPLGAFEVKIAYPADSIELNSFNIPDKNENEFIKEHHENGHIHILYSTRQPDITEKRIEMIFRSGERQISGQEITAELTDIVTYQKKTVSLKEICNVSFSVISDKQVSEQKASSGIKGSSSKSEVSSKRRTSVSKASSKSSESSENASSETKQSKAVSENSKVLQHFDKEKYKDDLSDDSAMYYIIGAVILVTVIIIAAVSFVRRINKKFPE